MIRKIYSIAVLILIAAPAMAGGPTIPAPVPEPGTFGLLAMSTVLLIIAARYKRRK